MSLQYFEDKLFSIKISLNLFNAIHNTCIVGKNVSCDMGLRQVLS